MADHDYDPPFPGYRPMDQSWKQNDSVYHPGDESAIEAGYFHEFGEFLRKRFAHDKEHLRDISHSLGLTENLSDISATKHQRSLAEIFGGGRAGELLGLMGEFQGKFLKGKSRAKGINFYKPEDSHHLQSIIETVERAAR